MLDAERWRQLSPHLDELLDLPAAERAARLAALRAEDAALADELAGLLAEHAALDEEGFLEAGALPAPAGLAGQSFGPYTLERLLGEGGMGQVWLARRADGRYEGQVAIKLLRGGLRAGAERARFAEEGRILARLDHPHIARLLDAGVAEGDSQPYLVIEHVDGEPIDRHLQQHAATPERVVALMIDACDAVAHAHARLVLHRDLKPSNMLVRHDGQLKLLDFGIAKLLDRPDAPNLTERVGASYTPRYAAPEQLQGEDVTTAGDVYALGVLLYELLGGGHPTADEGASRLEQLRAAVERVPRRLSDQVRRQGGADAARRARLLHGDLDAVIARALAKRPAERYANAAGLADDLRRWRDHQPVQARPDGWWYRSRLFVRRHRVPVAAAVLALAAVLAGVVVALRQAHEAQQRRRDAEGLVEFMLGDLRRRLQPVGRLDVLDSVGERVLAYYETQDASRLDADALGRRARALHLIGEIAERRGQLQEAARRFDSAAATTAALLARAPQDGQRLYDHAQSEYWVGYIAHRRGEPAAAEAGMRRYLALAEQLAALEHAPPDWLVERPSALESLGVMLLDAGRPREAAVQLQAAVDGLQPLLDRHPNSRAIATAALGWLARAREHAGDLPGAIAARTQSLRWLEAVARGGQRNSETSYDMAAAWNELAELRLKTGDAVHAQEASTQAVGLLQALVRQDPANLDWAEELGAALLVQGQVWSALGRSAEAAAAVDNASRALAPLWTAAPDNLRWQLMVRAKWLLARAALQPGAAPTDAELDAYVSRAEQAEAASGALDAEQSRLLAQVLMLRASRSREAEAARRDWRAAARRLQPPASQGHLTALALLGLAQCRLGETQAAARTAERLASTPYRHPLQAELLQCLAPKKGAGPGS